MAWEKKRKWRASYQGEMVTPIVVPGEINTEDKEQPIILSQTALANQAYNRNPLGQRIARGKGSEAEMRLQTELAALNANGAGIHFEKRNPAYRWVGNNKNKSFVPCEKSGADFFGYLRPDGLHFDIEVKKTNNPRLGLGKSGVKEHQLDALWNAHEGGALALLYWVVINEDGIRSYLIPGYKVCEQWVKNKKSITEDWAKANAISFEEAFKDQS